MTRKTPSSTVFGIHIVNISEWWGHTRIMLEDLESVHNFNIFPHRCQPHSVSIISVKASLSVLLFLICRFLALWFQAVHVSQVCHEMYQGNEILMKIEEHYKYEETVSLFLIQDEFVLSLKYFTCALSSKHPASYLLEACPQVITQVLVVYSRLFLLFSFFLPCSQDECISDTFLCDREEDCTDGSDEESCGQ